MRIFFLLAPSSLNTIGNPLIARTMVEHDIAAGLNVPVRLMIYEDAASRTTRLAYDLPSSLMSGLQNEKVAAAAKKLDAKLIARNSRYRRQSLEAISAQ